MLPIVLLLTILLLLFLAIDDTDGDIRRVHVSIIDSTSFAKGRELYGHDECADAA
jgi:hypothetical protein